MLKLAAAACALVLLGVSASAQTAPAPVSAYGRLPAIQAASLSADGSKIALLREYNGQLAISVVDVKTMAVIRGKAPQSDLTFRDVRWSLDGHLLVTASQTFNPFKRVEETGSLVGSRTTDARGSYEYSRILAMPVDEPTSVPLLHRSEFSIYTPGLLTQVWPARADESNSVRMLNIIDGAGGFTLTVQRVDLTTGTGVPVALGNATTTRFVVNGVGEAIARVDTLPDRNVWIAFARNGGDWQKIVEERSEFGGVPVLASPFPDGRLAILETRATRRDALYALDPKTGAITLVYGSATVNVDGVINDPWTREIVGVRTEGEAAWQHFFEADIESVRVAIAAAFADGKATIQSWDRARTAFIIEGFHGASPTAFYLYRPVAKSMTLLGSTYPELATAPIGKRVALTYKARDGVSIPAFLTVPETGAMANLPLVVFPHGGPAARDGVEFDAVASFFASRGYAVLQPNFRGSGGMGYDWEAAGRGQWGGVMQNDLTDGVGQLAKKGIVDPKRVCIVGVSYGGYAALAGATLTPDLYRCAVSVGGVADLNLFIDRMEERSGQNSSTRDYWKKSIGAGYTERALLKPISPSDNIAAIRAPILLMHSAQDTVVPIDQSKRMAAKLQTAGKNVRYVELKGDDHWLSYGSTRTQMLTEIEKFLGENMK